MACGLRVLGALCPRCVCVLCELFTSSEGFARDAPLLSGLKPQRLLQLSIRQGSLWRRGTGQARLERSPITLDPLL